jgi:hypothetical protein
MTATWTVITDGHHLVPNMTLTANSALNSRQLTWQQFTLCTQTAHTQYSHHITIWQWRWRQSLQQQHPQHFTDSPDFFRNTSVYSYLLPSVPKLQLHRTSFMYRDSLRAMQLQRLLMKPVIHSLLSSASSAGPLNTTQFHARLDNTHTHKE